MEEHTLTLRVKKGSDDDIFLNSNLNVDGVAIFNGSSKENIIKDGIPLVETWALVTGTITSSPTGTKNDQDGNALCEYVLTFRNAEKIIMEALEQLRAVYEDKKQL